MAMNSKCKICRSPATRRRGLVSFCSSIDCEAELGLLSPMDKTSSIKNKPRRKRAGHDKFLLNACRGQQCYLVVPNVCCSDSATVVPCHSNSHKHGKGMGIKADDKYTVPGCFTCHAWLDQSGAPREEKDTIWNNAYERWSVDRERIK